MSASRSGPKAGPQDTGASSIRARKLAPAHLALQGDTRTSTEDDPDSPPVTASPMIPAQATRIPMSRSRGQTIVVQQGRVSPAPSGSEQSMSTSNLLSHSAMATGASFHSSATSSLLKGPLSTSEKFTLPSDPSEWEAYNRADGRPEPDDELHEPDVARDKTVDTGGTVFTSRGFVNVGFMVFLALGLIALFLGYPVIIHLTQKHLSLNGGYNLGGMNASGQIPKLNYNGLIDSATPPSAYTRSPYGDSSQTWDLVFSDEFEVDGRSFYPGDDPYWTAVDLHYWSTGDMEYYDPAQITTKNGALVIQLAQKDPINNHNLSYASGMLQSWNQFCFTGGLLEVAVQMPGSNAIGGFWPAIWAMGNLGRAGYGATVDGMWPYNYDTCDIGTLLNQSVPGYPDVQQPFAAWNGGDPYSKGQLSMLPGQRLSACTCPGESHPGPIHRNGTFVGRSAPELDVFEATILNGEAWVSQSIQQAPFNAGYAWYNTSDNLQIYSGLQTSLNTYTGGVYQQTISALSQANQSCYQLISDCYGIYGLEYEAGYDNGYVTWISNDQQVMTVRGSGFAADPDSQIGARPIPQEPMYIIMNLAMSMGFSHFIPFDQLTFPATMKVDYVRVYQPTNAHNIGCDPPNFPTMNYIDTYSVAYSNWNLTSWDKNWKGDVMFGQPWPKNSMNPGGCS